MSPTPRTLVSEAQAASFLRSGVGEWHGEYEQASLTDPFEATAQTVRFMVRLIEHSIRDPILTAARDDAIARWSGWTGSDQGIGAAECFWWWSKYAIKFIHHQKLFQRWLGLQDELQLLISPEALLKLEKPQGDCAIFTMLLCALMELSQIQWEIVTVAVDPRQPDVFSHVYPRAVVNQRYVPLDASSHGKYPGWEVPRQRVTRLQIWDSAGSAVPDRDSGFRGLHGVDMRHGMACPCAGMSRAPQGLGQDGMIEPTIDPSVNPIIGSQSPEISWDPVTPSMTGGVTGSSGQSIWGSMFGNLANIFATTASRIAAPTTTITRGPGGQVSIVTPASQTANAALLAGGSSFTTSTSLLPILLVLGGGLLLFAMVKK